MAVVTREFSQPMQGDTDIANISTKIHEILAQAGLDAGIVTLFVKHTTASIMIFEDEPGLRQDTKDIWQRLIPPDPDWQHNRRNPGETNGHSHLRGQLQGQSLTIPFSGKALLLGRWQQIVLIDFDTCARNREIVVQIIGE